MEKESQNLNDTVLTKEELLQLKGGSAIIESSRDIHNINSTSGCSCVYLNHNVIGLEKTIKDLLSEFYKKEIKNSIS